MDKIKKVCLLVALFSSSYFAGASKSISYIYPPDDTIKKRSPPQQEDVIDVLRRVTGKKKLFAQDTAARKVGKIYPSLLPAAGYSITTGFTAVLAINASFYTALDNTNLSVITSDPLYSINKQGIVPLISNIWLKNNKINLLGDYRFYKYPSETYGLGSKSLLKNVDSIDYSYLKVWQAVLFKISHNLYAGPGYALDYHNNITSDNSESEIEQYSNGATKSLSSGAIMQIQYDSRENINNPVNAFYVSIKYRDNLTALGSYNNWQSLEFDFRKYIKILPSSPNVLAFWSWDVFTFDGKPPYLDLPSTGWDTYSNTGRGYIQGRFRGSNMIYLEGEDRFRITRNGLLGGVVFVNAETVSKLPSLNKASINPAEGLGLRIKLNRYSDTNLCIDYAFGDDGSRGFFFNVGEVF
jgi:hypothetical protein